MPGLLQRISDAVRLGRGDDLLRPTGRAGEGTAVAPPAPWVQSGELERVILADIYGAELPIERDTAMKVPAIAKGRGLIAGTLSRYPLRAYRGETEVARQPAWLSRSDTGQPPQWRMLWTLDDLIFHGRSLWATRRHRTSRAILDAVRVPFDEWEIDDDLHIVVQGRPVDDGDVIYFDGPQDALLDLARTDIKAAIAMTHAWSSRVESPTPLVELHHSDEGHPLSDDEIASLVSKWETARRNGGTAYTPQALQMIDHGSTQTDLFVAGRNSSRLDFANFLALPATMLDGSTSTASLTYSTREGQKAEFVDLSLAYWSSPIAARLSADDITPAGTRIDFDIRWLSSSPKETANPPAED